VFRHITFRFLSTTFLTTEPSYSVIGQTTKEIPPPKTDNYCVILTGYLVVNVPGNKTFVARDTERVT